jgi:integrase
MVIAGQAANKAAARAVFIDYRTRKAANTTRRQDADLALFAEYLKSAGLHAGNFATDPKAWQGIMWGVVEGFVKWQLLNGYAVESVNVRLSTIKTYARLALKAGALDVSEYAMIRTVQGYGFKEAKRVDETRKAEGLYCRRGNKKAHAVIITDEQAAQLMAQENTPQGKRDALIMCLMLEHGLRLGEVEGLQVHNFDVKNRCMTFYREKMSKEQTHRLTDRTLDAARAYMKHAPKDGSLWRASAEKREGKTLAGKLTTQGISERAINKRVELLGRKIGIDGLSPHDLRHYWATNASRKGTPVKSLQEAGGWNSPAMPLHYIEAEQVANDGMII